MTRPVHSAPQNGRALSIFAFALLALSSTACGSGSAPVAADPLAPDALGSVQIAPVHEALTFARIESEGEPRVLAVTRYEDGIVEGLYLPLLLGRPAGDPISVFLEEGYDRLRDLVLQDPLAARISVPWRKLILPVDLGTHNIAAGTNFPSHAGEADVEGGPFLFAKLALPTGPLAPVSAGQGLLDYEVELAWVPFEPILDEERPAAVGLILCNDYTDRETLLHHIDVWDVESGKGFTTGKSFPGYLPVGNLFVVPRDLDRFTEALVLRLYVNGQLRQSSPFDAKIWGIDEFLAETWARRDETWGHGDTEVSLLNPEGTIDARTLLLAGTPSGTVFRGIGLGQRLEGFRAWLFGGWDQPLPEHVIEAYVRDARSQRLYLQPGDQVAIHVERMGVIANEITE